MNNNFTPGPWHVIGEVVMDRNIEIIEGDPNRPAYEWEFIASVHYETDEENQSEKSFTKEIAEANARLIAAAPELLDALELLVPPQCPIVTHHKPDCDFCRALKAIAKAKGGNNG